MENVENVEGERIGFDKGGDKGQRERLTTKGGDTGGDYLLGGLAI